VLTLSHFTTDDRKVWLELDWPLPNVLASMNAEQVVVEARFDSRQHGHMACCRGTLIDIHAMWQQGFESNAYVPNHETRIDALEHLQFKTGWIFLGVQAMKKAPFRTTNGWIQTWFEFITQTGASGPTRIPKPGERIRMTERIRIHIRDYASSGELHRLEGPMAHGRSSSHQDETRLWLPPDAVVQIADVDVSHNAVWGNFVWVRITPVPQKSPAR